jgi:hypothetical protein
MPSCYLCGHKIVPGDEMRMNLPTGYSISEGGFMTGRGSIGVGGYVRQSWGLRTVCSNCYKDATNALMLEREKSNRRNRILLLIGMVVAAIVVVVIVLGTINERRSPHASSPDDGSYTGQRGGTYHYSESGKKVYEKH